MKKEYIKISLKRMFLSKNKNRKKVILFDSSLDTFNIGDDEDYDKVILD